MKKFFLIPLMTLMCSVMAWGVDFKELPDPAGILNAPQAKASIRKALMDEEPAANEAKIGGTKYATLQDAIDAAANGAVIELLSDVAANVEQDAAVIEDKDITIKGNGFVLNGAVNLFGATKAIHVTFDGVQVNSPAWAWIVYGDAELILASGSTNSLASAAGYGCYGFGNCNLVISGTGSLTASMLYSFYHAKSVQVDAPNVTFSGTDLYHWSASWGNLSFALNGGSYSFDPSSFVNFNSRVVTKPSELYVVSAPAADVVAYNPALYTTYTSLSAAIDAASAGNEIYMYKADATAISVGMNLTIHTSGFSTNLTAASGYARADMGQNIAFTDNAIAAFLMADGTNSMTIDANSDISAAGAIHVNGDKTLTINAGVEVLYKRQGDYANIVVDNGAKLTVLGSGTFTPVMHSETRTIEGFTAEISTSASNQIGNRVIDVDGELVVGVKNDAANCPHFITSSIARGSAVMVNETGVATFNNADMHVASMSIKNYGNVTIHGGEYVSIATSRNQINNGWYAYHLNNEGIMTVNGGHFVGVQGAFSNATANAIVTINGGSFETVYGHNWATGEANTGANKDNFYALYVACYSVVNVYGGSYKVQTPSLGGNVVVLVGNNDAYNTYGIVNLYGGKFQQKVKIQARKNAQSSYPASIPSTSQWYGCFGSLAPLPAGYEYYDITEGEDYEAGYRYGVRGIAGKEPDAIAPDQKAAQELDPTYTIPWQQATTWAAAEVPEENTIVTIPVDATVTVKNDPGLSNEAVADQVFVAQGATLKVETGTTLNIGEGGMNIGNGGQIVVEPGAVVTVGEAGIITTEDEALVIEATEEDQGVLLLHPEVTENTQPKATVKLVTKCKQVGANEFVWERFAIPTLDGAQTTFNAERLDTVTIYGGGSFEQGLYEWDGSAWTGVGNWHDLKPSKGYQLTNNSMYGNVVYTFEGNLVGNVDKGYEFAESGFGFFGNSYTGDIDILKFFESFGSDMQKTIWIYDYYTDGFKAITETSYGSVYYGKRNARHGAIKDIRSMQAFLMNTFAAGESTQSVDYSAAIWGNPKYGLVPTPTPAPAKRVAANEDKFTVYVAGAKQEDEVTFIRSNAYSAAFDNGADASKWMNNGLNLYVATEDGELASVASDEIVDMTIAFQSGNETEYTLGFDNLRGETFELRDILTGATIQMTEGATYTFSQEANTTVPARFQIIGARKVATGVENESEGAAVQQKVIENGVLYILRDNKWYNAQGQIVK